MYRFSLSAVLNHRKYLEENLQKELAALNILLADEKNKLDKLEIDRQQLSAKLEIKQRKSMTVSENLLYVRFMEHLSERQKNQQIAVCKTEQIVHSKREELVEAVKNRKAMELLRDKELVEYRRKQHLTEQNFMNEMASVRFKRKY